MTDHWAEVEAEEDERRERQHDAADEMAEGARIGNAIARAERRGICTHGSAVSYRKPPAHPEQEGLKPGQLRCTKGTGGCTRVFDSDADWYRAMDDAVGR
jgi:hypothetical protein